MGITEKNIEDILYNAKDDFSIISIPTGSGKTTTLLEGIVNRNMTVMSLQPTRVAAKEIATYMKTKLGDINVGSGADSIIEYINIPLSKLCKGKSLLEEDFDKVTPLVYCTYGHFKNKLLSVIKHALLNENRDLINYCFCDIVVLDEAHSGNADLELIMYLLKYGKEDLGMNLPNVILASATINPDETPFPYSKFFKIESRTYPITIEYINTDFSLNDQKIYDFTVEKILENHNKNPPGKGGSTWIVFCSGRSEVDKICDAINSLSDRSFFALPAYSELDRSEISKLFIKTPPSRRKLVVGTNMIEMSITIDNADFVYDLIREKVVHTSISGESRLVLKYATKSSSRQRSGRVGRTCPGKVLRMCTEEFFLGLPAKRQGEIYRIPIHVPIIELINSLIDPLEIFRDTDSDLICKIEQTIDTLKKLDMLKDSSLKYKVTKIGNFVAEMPMTIRYSACLYKCLEIDNCPRFQSVAICMILNTMESGSYLHYPNFKGNYIEKELQRERYYDKHFEKFQDKYSITSLEPLINVFNIIIEYCLNPNTLAIRYNELSSKCNELKLNYSRVLECLKNIGRIITFEKIKEPYYRNGKISFDRFELIDIKFVENYFPDIISEVFFDRIFEKEFNSSYIKDGVSYKIRTAFRTFQPDRIFVTSSSETQIGTTINSFINFYFTLPGNHYESDEYIEIEDSEDYKY